MDARAGRAQVDRPPDKRYTRSEAKIQNTIDTMFKDKTIATKITDFCILAKINPTTFYNHYASISEVVFFRDTKEVDELEKYLLDGCTKALIKGKSLKVKFLFRKTFQYIIRHRAYFEGAAARNNIGLFKGLMVIIKPILLESWYDHYKRNDVYADRIECIYRKLIFEVTSEYNEWIEVEKFDTSKIDARVKHLTYLADTAPRRLNRYRLSGLGPNEYCPPGLNEQRPPGLNEQRPPGSNEYCSPGPAPLSSGKKYAKIEKVSDSFRRISKKD